MSSKDARNRPVQLAPADKAFTGKAHSPEGTVKTVARGYISLKPNSN